MDGVNAQQELNAQTSLEARDMNDQSGAILPVHHLEWADAFATDIWPKHLLLVYGRSSADQYTPLRVPH